MTVNAATQSAEEQPLHSISVTCGTAMMNRPGPAAHRIRQIVLCVTTPSMFVDCPPRIGNASEN